MQATAELTESDDLKQDKTPLSEWLPKVLRTRPEVLEIHERARPLTHRGTFGRQIGTTKTEAPQVLSHENGSRSLLLHLNHPTLD